MARHESDREDLLREATALVERAELLVDGEPEPIVIGFRRDGAGAVYLGAVLVFQFNSRGELRRGFRDGLLLKAELGKLAQFRREREQDAVYLVRHDLTESETTEFLELAEQSLQRIGNQLATGRYRVSGQVPEHADVVGRIVVWLASLPRPFVIAQGPRTG